MPAKVNKTEGAWRRELSPEQYEILRQKGTERPWSHDYNNEKRSGTYRCAGCGAELFPSDTKFESRSGWRSSSAPAETGGVEAERAASLGMVRTEVLCSSCGGHLGHVFEDGPNPTGLR